MIISYTISYKIPHKIILIIVLYYFLLFHNLTLFLPAVVTWRSYMGWFRPWPVGIGLKRLKSNSLLTVRSALSLRQQSTVSRNHSQSIKTNLGPSNGRTIVPSIHRSIVLYWRLTDFRSILGPFRLQCKLWNSVLEKWSYPKLCQAGVLY